MDSCPVCTEPALEAVGAEDERSCTSCHATLGRCAYCGLATLQHGPGARFCVNATCAAYKVNWRMCPDCEAWRIPVVREDVLICIDTSHTMVQSVRCFVCEHEFPKPLGACIHRGCRVALQPVETCFFCKKLSRLVKGGVCCNPECSVANLRTIRCRRCGEWSVPGELFTKCKNEACGASRTPIPASTQVDEKKAALLEATHLSLSPGPAPAPAATTLPPPSNKEKKLLDALVSSKDASERYELKKIVFEGGMGAIWRAFDRILDREVAIKVAREEFVLSPAVRTQFLKEARIGARLLHPNVLPVFDVGVFHDERVYFTMRFVDGASFRQTIDSIATGCATNFVEFPLRKVVGTIAHACQGVDFAHQHGVIHLDLKPDNILVSGFSEVFVIDWGIARVDGEDDTARLADLYLARAEKVKEGTTSTMVGKPDQVTGRSGPVVGTPGYMAPEQFDGAGGPVSAATDVFGLGGILFFALYGNPPCREGEENMNDTMRATLAPQKAGKLRPGIVPRGERVSQERLDAIARLETICMKSLERDPSTRHPTVNDLIIELNEWLAATKGIDAS